MAIYIAGMYKNRNKSIHNNQTTTHQYVYPPAIQGEPIQANQENAIWNIKYTY
jgi:hypothetical protein